MSGFYYSKTKFNKADGPCKDCPDRCVGCHSQCVKYIDWKQKREALLNKAQAEREINDAIITLNGHTHNQIRKQTNKRK